MSEENNTPGTQATSEQAAAPVAPVAPEPNGNGEPDWLPKRLEQAKSSAVKDVLSALGASDLEHVQGSLKELADLKAAQMSEAEKQQARISELEGVAKEAEGLRGALKTVADAQLLALSDDQRSAVSAVAGADPSSIISTISALRPTWAAAATAAQTAAPVTSPDTAPAGGPPDSGTSSEPGLKEQLDSLREKNPIAAASFMARNGGPRAFM